MGILTGMIGEHASAQASESSWQTHLGAFLDALSFKVVGILRVPTQSPPVNNRPEPITEMNVLYAKTNRSAYWFAVPTTVLWTMVTLLRIKTVSNVSGIDV
jgi:hypothetical protein